MGRSWEECCQMCEDLAPPSMPPAAVAAGRAPPPETPPAPPSSPPPSPSPPPPPWPPWTPFGDFGEQPFPSPFRARICSAIGFDEATSTCKFYDTTYFTDDEDPASGFADLVDYVYIKPAPPPPHTPGADACSVFQEPLRDRSIHPPGHGRRLQAAGAASSTRAAPPTRSSAAKPAHDARRHGFTLDEASARCSTSTSCPSATSRRARKSSPGASLWKWRRRAPRRAEVALRPDPNDEVRAWGVDGSCPRHLHRRHPSRRRHRLHRRRRRRRRQARRRGRRRRRRRAAAAATAAERAAAVATLVELQTTVALGGAGVGFVFMSLSLATAAFWALRRGGIAFKKQLTGMLKFKDLVGGQNGAVQCGRRKQRGVAQRLFAGARAAGAVAR